LLVKKNQSKLVGDCAANVTAKSDGGIGIPEPRTQGGLRPPCVRGSANA
jgi:hypothetical protein